VGCAFPALRSNGRAAPFVADLGAGRAFWASLTNLAQILDEILDESKLEAGMIRLENVDFDLGKTVEDVVTILRPRAEQKSLRIDLAMSPPACGDFHGDPTRLRQILLNLAGNAIKFTDTGRVSVEVSVIGQGAMETKLRFEVSDTGVGIEPEARSRLFQKFTQADVSITRRFGGTGLGLAISRQLVEMMGGTIGFDSEIGQGTTFWFELALRSATTFPVKAPDDTAPPEIPDGKRRSFDVLVADDNKVNQQVARLMLSHAGHRVDVVDNGLEAVKAVQRKSYDCVLMDVQMPELDGVAATRRIRGLGGAWADLPIIALTAHAMAGTDTELLAAGMNDYLSKPFDAGTLLRKVERLVTKGMSRAARLRVDDEAAVSVGFDSEKLSELRQLTGPREFAPMVKSFVEALEERVTRLVALAGEGKLQEAGREAHDVVSIAGNLGGLAIVELARRIELEARNGDADHIRALAATLRAETDSLLPMLQRFTAEAAA
jgi:CheY-like chemotaxis protein/HPt (histidine-containing phosphotransfer) domain-containing protein